MQSKYIRGKTTVIPCATCAFPLNVTASRYSKSRTKQFFCNSNCHAKWLSQNNVGENHPRYHGVTVTCDHCGEPFHIIPSKLDSQEHHFCSRPCQHKWNSIHRRGEKSHNWKGGMATVFCEYCDTPIERYQCMLEKQDMFFCDMQCKGAWHSENLSGEHSPIYKKVKVPCSQCGTIVLRHPCRMEEHKNHFCSKECFGKWISENKSGVNSYQWNPDKTLLYYGPGWRRISREIRHRDNFQCCHCGISEKKLGKALDVHHVVPLRNFNGDYKSANRPDNLVSLCKSCHNQAEHGSIPIQPYLLSIP